MLKMMSEDVRTFSTIGKLIMRCVFTVLFTVFCQLLDPKMGQGPLGQLGSSQGVGPGAGAGLGP